MPKSSRRRRRHNAGTAPGTLTADPHAASSKVVMTRYGRDFIEERELTRGSKEIATAEAADVLWIDVAGLADVELLRWLGQRFDLHRLALEDVLTSGQRPKVEEFDDHLFIVVRAAHVVDGRFDGDQVSLFTGPGWVVTFREHPERDCFAAVRTRLRQASRWIRRSSSDYLSYALLDAVIDQSFPVLDVLGDQLDAIEQALVSEPEVVTIGDLHVLRNELRVLRRFLRPQQEALLSLLRVDDSHLSAETRTHLRDCLDHATHALELADAHRDLALSLLDLHQSVMSQRLNDVMRVLTVIATIFMPLSFIAGLYGMNFDTSSPLNMPELRWAWGYPFCLGLMLIVVVAMVGYFRRAGWLGGASRGVDGG